ncbi:uncharacterized protein LOC132201752 [Neocloeon triangulifer]|uniref:uncharacterized protein LOC132201752 n=1 Tax=Neocloeon triangulifer TaxID=2078957 RepID=UPI00286EE749|nr:uncharacterized protein LOC132201752 [Neocloeon triangulifer]
MPALRNLDHSKSFAPDTDDAVPRVWFERRFVSSSSLSRASEVQLGVKAPVTANRIYTTSDHQLVIQHFLPDKDGNIFECRRFGHEDVLPVKYLLDHLKPLNAKTNFDAGNWTDFRKFEEQNLMRLSEAVQELANDDRPTVLMHWGAWSECQSCKMGSGRWWRRGRCRIVVPRELKVLPYNLTAISCRSSMLDLVHLDDEFKTMLLSLPDFILYDTCECVYKGNFHKQLLEGDSTLLMCPRNSSFELVQWSKGLDLLTAGQWTYYGKKCRVRVDVMGTLLIENAEREVSGQFLCRAGQILHRFLVTVEQRSILSSLEFQQSLFVVSVVLFLCFAVYVAYICMLWFEPPNVRSSIIGGYKNKKKETRKLSVEELELQPWMANFEQLDVTLTDYDADRDEDGDEDDEEEWIRLTPDKSHISVTVERAQVNKRV